MNQGYSSRIYRYRDIDRYRDIKRLEDMIFCKDIDFGLRSRDKDQLEIKCYGFSVFFKIVMLKSNFQQDDIWRQGGFLGVD